MKRTRKIRSAFLLSFLTFFLVAVGFSTWVINGTAQAPSNEDYVEFVPSDLTTFLENKTGTNPSYIYDSKTNAASGDYSGVYNDSQYDEDNRVISLGRPGEVLEISSPVHFTHRQNDIDYGIDDFLGKSPTEDGGFATTAADGGATTNSARPINYYYDQNYDSRPARLYTIRLAGDVTVTSGGILSIGALVGSSSGGGNAGCVIEGSFVALDLNGHTLTIQSGATMNAYGYLLDSATSKIDGQHIGEVDCSGTIYAGFVVEDYGGGGTTVGRAAFSTMPFSTYSMPYLSCSIRFRHGSVLTGATMLYAQSMMTKTQMNVLGPSGSLFNLTSADSVIVRDGYNNLSDSTDAVNSYEANHRVEYDFYGSVTVESMTLNTTLTFSGLEMTANIEMSQFSFYIPSYYHFRVRKDCDLTLPLTLLLSPGATVMTEEGSLVRLTSRDFDSNVVIQDVPLFGDVEVDIEKGTSRGGLIVLSELPVDSSTAFYGYSKANYNFSRSRYQKYELEETERNVQKNPRVTIGGSIQADGEGHPLAGMMNLSESTKDYLNGNASSFDTFVSRAIPFSYMGGDIDLGSAIGTLLGGSIKDMLESSIHEYLIVPLMVNDDLSSDSPYHVFRSEDIDSTLTNGETEYDYRTGVYSVGQNQYIYVTDSESPMSGTMTPIESYVSEDHLARTATQYYAYYRGQQVEVPDPTATFDAYAAYVYDNQYSSSTRNFYPVSNDSTTYTISMRSNTETWVGDGEKGTASRNRTSIGIVHGPWGDFSPMPTEYSVTENTTTNYLTNQSVTISSMSLFSSVSYTSGTTGYYPADITRFSGISSYSRIGTISLTKHIDEGTSDSGWTYTGDDNTGSISGSSFGTQTQTVTWDYFTRTISQTPAQDWSSGNRSLYAPIASLQFDSTLGVWRKGATTVIA